MNGYIFQYYSDLHVWKGQLSNWHSKVMLEGSPEVTVIPTIIRDPTYVADALKPKATQMSRDERAL